MDDYVQALKKDPNVDANVLPFFIHYWNVTIPEIKGNKNGMYDKNSI